MLVVELVSVINVKLDILYFCFVLLMLAVRADLSECYFFYQNKPKQGLQYTSGKLPMIFMVHFFCGHAVFLLHRFEIIFKATSKASRC